MQPTEVPKFVQPVKEEPKQEESKSDDDGVEGGVEGGVAGGVVGGAVGAPPPKQEEPKKAVLKPAFLLKSQKTGGQDPHLPEVIKAQRKGQTVQGTYKICIDLSGQVREVNTVSSIPGADENVISALRSWTFKPQPIPVCTMWVIQFIVE